MTINDATFESLFGLHSLDAVDEGSTQVTRSSWSGDMEEANYISFRIDGVVYTAIEDPESDYCSRMDILIVDKRDMKNTFPPVQVMAKKKGNGDYQKNETLEFVDVVTGKVVLEVGTDNCNDDYPYFVGTFSPQNMATNAKVES